MHSALPARLLLLHVVVVDHVHPYGPLKIICKSCHEGGAYLFERAPLAVQVDMRVTSFLRLYFLCTLDENEGGSNPVLRAGHHELRFSFQIPYG